MPGQPGVRRRLVRELRERASTLTGRRTPRKRFRRLQRTAPAGVAAVCLAVLAGCGGGPPGSTLAAAAGPLPVDVQWLHETQQLVLSLWQPAGGRPGFLAPSPQPSPAVTADAVLVLAVGDADVPPDAASYLVSALRRASGLIVDASAGVPPLVATAAVLDAVHALAPSATVPSNSGVGTAALAAERNATSSGQPLDSWPVLDQLTAVAEILRRTSVTAPAAAQAAGAALCRMVAGDTPASVESSMAAFEKAEAVAYVAAAFDPTCRIGELVVSRLDGAVQRLVLRSDGASPATSDPLAFLGLLSAAAERPELLPGTVRAGLLARAGAVSRALLDSPGEYQPASVAAETVRVLLALGERPVVGTTQAAESARQAQWLGELPDRSVAGDPLTTVLGLHSLLIAARLGGGTEIPWPGQVSGWMASVPWTPAATSLVLAAGMGSSFPAQAALPVASVPTLAGPPVAALTPFVGTAAVPCAEAEALSARVAMLLQADVAHGTDFAEHPSAVVAVYDAIEVLPAAHRLQAACRASGSATLAAAVASAGRWLRRFVESHLRYATAASTGQSSPSTASIADVDLLTDDLQLEGACELGLPPPSVDLAPVQPVVGRSGGVVGGDGAFSIVDSYLLLRILELREYGCSGGWWTGPTSILPSVPRG